MRHFPLLLVAIQPPLPPLISLWPEQTNGQNKEIMDWAPLGINMDWALGNSDWGGGGKNPVPPLQ